MLARYALSEENTSIPVADISALMSGFMSGTAFGPPSESLDSLVLSLMGLHVMRECLQAAPVVSKIWTDFAGAATIANFLNDCITWSLSVPSDVTDALVASLGTTFAATQASSVAFAHSELCILLLELLPWKQAAYSRTEASDKALITIDPQTYLMQGCPILEDPVDIAAASVSPSVLEQPASYAISTLEPYDLLWHPACFLQFTTQSEVLLSACGTIAALFLVPLADDSQAWEDAEVKLRRMGGDTIAAAITAMGDIHPENVVHMQRSLLLICRRFCEVESVLALELARVHAWYVMIALFACFVLGYECSVCMTGCIR